MDGEKLNAMSRDITLGISKKDTKISLNAEEEKTWDKLQAEISAADGVVDLPYDNTEPLDTHADLYSSGFNDRISELLKKTNGAE